VRNAGRIVRVVPEVSEGAALWIKQVEPSPVGPNPYASLAVLINFPDGGMGQGFGIKGIVVIVGEDTPCLVKAGNAMGIGPEPKVVI
jgi:hypothetical protein